MAGPAVPADADILTVSALTRQVRSTIENEFGAVWVAGEISNLARPASGHLYLSLKDDKATLRTVIYRGVAIRDPLRATRRPGSRRPRPAHGLRTPRRIPVRRRGDPSQGDRGPRTRLATTPRTPGPEGLFRPASQEAVAAVPAGDRPGDEPERGGRSRHARTPGPPLAGRRHHHHSDPRPGRRGGHRDRHRRPDGESVPSGRVACPSMPSSSAAAAGAWKTCGRSTRKSSPTRSSSRGCRSSAPSATRST